MFSERLVDFSDQCIALATGRHSTVIQQFGLGDIGNFREKYRLNLIVEEGMDSLWRKGVFLLAHKNGCPSLVSDRYRTLMDT